MKSRLRRSDWRRFALFVEDIQTTDTTKAAFLGLETLLKACRAASGAVYIGKAGALAPAAALDAAPGAAAAAEKAASTGRAVQAKGLLAVPFPSKQGAVVLGTGRHSPADEAFAARVASALDARIFGTASAAAAKSAAPVSANGATPYARIFESLPSGVLVWDTQGRLLAANRRACTLLKKDLHASVGEPVKGALKEREGFSEGITEITHAGKPVSRRSMTINLEGEARTIGYSGGPIGPEEGPAEGYVILFQDISKYVSV